MKDYTSLKSGVMPRSIGAEAGYLRGEGGSLLVLGGQGDGEWAREKQDEAGQECTFSIPLSREADMNRSPSGGRHGRQLLGSG